jgi:hypothetical protein
MTLIEATAILSNTFGPTQPAWLKPRGWIFGATHRGTGKEAPQQTGTLTR